MTEEMHPFLRAWHGVMRSNRRPLTAKTTNASVSASVQSPTLKAEMLRPSDRPSAFALQLRDVRCRRQDDQLGPLNLHLRLIEHLHLG